MEEFEYLSIKEFAEKAGVSTQAVYARLGKDLQPFSKIEYGRNAVSTEALPLFSYKEKENDSIIDWQLVLKSLQAQLEVKDNQIHEKDKQLHEKDKQIEKLTTALINEQQSAQQAHVLHAGTLNQALIEDKSKTRLFSRWFKK